MLPWRVSGHGDEQLCISQKRGGHINYIVATPDSFLAKSATRLSAQDEIMASPYPQQRAPAAYAPEARPSPLVVRKPVTRMGAPDHQA